MRRSGAPPPPLSPWAWAADVALAVVMAVGTLTVYYTHTAGDVKVRPGIFLLPPPPPAGENVSGAVQPGVAVLALLTALPLVVRRRYPLCAFWAVLIATLLFTEHQQSGDATTLTFVSCLIAAYTAATYSPYRARAILSLVLGAALLAIRHDTAVPGITSGYVPFLVLLGLGMAANSAHVWKQRVAALEAEREEATRHAVAGERARIARELHDVVTHNVAVMVVQAGAARKVIDTAPDQARESMLAVEAGGRAALAELRHVMGLLTVSGNEPDALAPQPGLDQLAALTSRVRDTGVPVDLAVTGTPLGLSAGIDLTAYRVVQEALTNTLKHAAGSRVRIAVDYGADAVRVEVADSGGVLTAAAGSGNGRGLAGLRERVAVYGGTLHAGVLPSGGYRVRAVIPVEPS